MTTGVLMYCFDTPDTQYHRMANRSMALVQKNLGLPVTVVTDASTLDNWAHKPNVDFVTIESEKTNSKLGRPWYNVERHQSYDHSPYDVTMVLDADYFCFSHKLLKYTNTHYDFLVHKSSHDVSGVDGMNNQRASVIDMVWATVLIFKKTPKVKAVFDTVELIKQNYQHFCDLYRVTYRNFRNDFAFAIALNQIYGFGDYGVIPDSIPAVLSHVDICALTDRSAVLKHNDRVFEIEDCDLHFINKGVIDV